MTLFFLLLAACFASQLWLTYQVSRSSVPLAVATFFLGPIGAVVTLVKERDHPDTRVTVPFIVNLVLTLALIASAWPLLGQADEEAAADLAAIAREAESQASSASGPHIVMGDGLPSDPLERLSHQLAQAGLKHQLTPMGADAKLPAGVLQGADLVIEAPAGDGNRLQAHVMRCRDGRTCKQLAGRYKLSAKKGEPVPQVTQNGMLLLVVRPNPALEGLHHVVQGVFRRTSFGPT